MVIYECRENLVKKDEHIRPLRLSTSHICPCKLYTSEKKKKKRKFFIKDFLSKCDQIRSFLRIWSHLLKKSLTKNFIFCAVLPYRIMLSIMLKIMLKKTETHPRPSQVNVQNSFVRNFQLIKIQDNLQKLFVWSLFSVCTYAWCFSISHLF